MNHAAHPSSAGLQRAPLLVIGGLIVATVLTVATVRITGVGRMQVIDAPTVEVLELRFEDRPDGGIDVLEGTSRRVIETVAPGSNGFLRGTMRGFARERKLQGVSAALPFRMVGHADGRLTLEDPTTARRVDLGSFGPTNGAVFADIMVRYNAGLKAATAAPPAATR